MAGAGGGHRPRLPCVGGGPVPHAGEGDSARALLRLRGPGPASGGCAEAAVPSVSGSKGSSSSKRQAKAQPQISRDRPVLVTNGGRAGDPRGPLFQNFLPVASEGVPHPQHQRKWKESAPAKRKE